MNKKYFKFMCTFIHTVKLLTYCVNNESMEKPHDGCIPSEIRYK